MRLHKHIPATLALAAVLAHATAHAQSDECAAATAITGVGAFPFDTTGATTSQPPWPCASGGHDVWFRWTAPADGDFRFETCAGTSYDSVLEVFRGDCSAPISLGCSDDACGRTSRVDLSFVVAGHPYLVRVGGIAGAAGDGTLTVSALGRQPLLDQQRLVSHPYAGFGGAHVSQRHNCVMGYQANSFVQTDSVMDDFTIDDEADSDGWMVTRFRAYAFDCTEDSSPPAVPASALTQLSLRIWDDVPYSPAAQVIFGDLETNVLSSTGWTGIYRAPGASTRELPNWPIMYADAAVDLFLPENATYWIEWGLDSSGTVCLNQPAVAANPGARGNALAVLQGGSPLPTDPRAYACSGNAGNSFDELPFQIFGERVEDSSFGDPACVPSTNSSGSPAALELHGTGVAGDPIAASVTQGRPMNLGYFLSSVSAGPYFVPPGSMGVLCLGAPQLRYRDLGLGHVFRFDEEGMSRAIVGGGQSILQTDGSYEPVPAVAPGETRYFQAWYRDGTTSNFSDSRGVTFE